MPIWSHFTTEKTEIENVAYVYIFVSISDAPSRQIWVVYHNKYQATWVLNVLTPFTVHPPPALTTWYVSRIIILLNKHYHQVVCGLQSSYPLLSFQSTDGTLMFAFNVLRHWRLISIRNNGRIIPLISSLLLWRT